MGKFKKLIGIILSVAVFATSVFVGGMVASSASLNDLFEATNNYDNLKEDVTFVDAVYASKPATSVAVGEEIIMDDATYALHFSAHGAQVQPVPEELGDAQGNAVHFTYAQNQNSTERPIVKVYDSSEDTPIHFSPKASTTYEISLSYYAVQTPSKEIKLQVHQSKYARVSFQGGDDDEGVYMEPADICSITKATDGWVEVKAIFTAPATPYYMSLILSSGTESAASSVDVWLDDVEVRECITVTAHNYDASSSKAIPVTKYTTVSDIQIPEVAGYRFCGVFSDADYTSRLASSDVVGEFSEIYFKWEPLALGQYYCGFDDYAPQIASMSYDTNIVSITDETTYVGSKALKATLAANGITAFELRDEAPFEIAANTEYTVTFAYRSTAAIEIYAGLAKAGDVSGSAYGLGKVSSAASDNWQTATITFTPDKGTADGYALAMLIYSEAGATVYIDDVLVTCTNVKTVTPTLNTGFSSDWYPGLAVFEGVEIPEIWDGSIATEFADGTGTEDDPYIISNGAELAYAITSGGTIDGTAACNFILSEDIYLNDVESVNWATGEPVGNYSPNLWYKSNGWSWSDSGVGDISEVNFAGTIDGDGHTVYGLYGNSTDKDYSNTTLGVALIPKTAEGGTTTVKNLGIDCAYIKCSYNSAAFVSSNLGVLAIDSCYVGENVTLDGYCAAAFRARGSTRTDISNCYSLATLKAYDPENDTDSLYGLVSAWSSMAITNCYNANGPIYSHVSQSEYASVTLTNCYESITVGYDDAAVQVDKAYMQGTDVLTDTAKMPNLNTGVAYTATDTYPILSVFVEETDDTEATIEVWDGKVATAFAGGTGTEEDPFIISNGAQLAYAITTSGTDEANYNKYYKLDRDIYLNNLDEINWVTGAASSVNKWYDNTEKFAGTIDGGGHTVYGLYFDDKTTTKVQYSWGVGLIPEVIGGNSAVISDLGIDYCFINSENGASAFVGSIEDSGSTVTIENCYIGSNVTISSADAGAFRGYANAGTKTTVTNCYSLAGSITGTLNYGFIGNVWGTSAIKNSYNATGPILSSSDTSGITVTNCYETEGSGYDYSGAVTITSANMKGEDVLEADGKMPLLNADNAFVATSLDFADHDWYVYLPEGTYFAEDFEPTFLDTFFMPLDSEEILLADTMQRGAYVKFALLPDAAKIIVPEALFDSNRQGTMAELQNSSTYYGIDLEIVTKQLSNQPDDAVNYIFITDTHYGNGWNSSRGQDPAIIKQMELIAKIASENDNIDFVVLGGDITNGAFNSKDTHIEAMQKVLNPLKECGKPVFVLMGNHDDGAWGTQFSMEHMISDKEWKDNVLALYSPDTIQHDSQDTNSKYYYYDLEKGGKTTRIVCLDSIDYDHSYDSESGAITELVVREGYESYDDSSADKWLNGWTYWGYSPAQLKWLANVLSEGDKFDDVIFLSHMGIDETTYPNPCTIHYSDEMRALISAYQQKTSYTNPDIGIEVDYSDTTGKILSYQFGHTHMELTLYSEDVELWQINTSTSNKEQNTASPTKAYKQAWNVLSQKLNTDSEACFDLMSVTERGILKLNVGAGNSARLINPVKISGDVNIDSATDICDLVELHISGDSASRTTAADVDRNGVLEALSDAEALRRLLIGK